MMPGSNRSGNGGISADEQAALGALTGITGDAHHVAMRDFCRLLGETDAGDRGTRYTEDTMKGLLIVLAVLGVAFLGACQRGAPPERGAEPAAAVPPAAPPPPAAVPAGSPVEVPQPEATAPALTSSPAPVPRVLAAGTALPLLLQTTVASNASQAGDRVVASLAEDAAVDGRVILVAGTEVMGRVTLAQQSGRVKGRARLVVEFDEVRDGGAAYRIEATPIDVTADSSKGKDAKIAGGAAAAGVLIGAIAGGGKGALKGGAIGGAAGGAAVLATRGKEVVLEAGTPLEVKLTHPIQID